MESDSGQNITFGSIAAAAGLILGFLVGLLLAWIFWSRSKEERKVSDVRKADVERLPVEFGHLAAAQATAPENGGSPDDLTIIEGVGPRFSSVLKEAGVTTFEQLGACRPDEITAMLDAEDPRLARLADPTSWPEQAILAAAGDWDALEALQEVLKGGRRV